MHAEHACHDPTMSPPRRWVRTNAMQHELLIRAHASMNLCCCRHSCFPSHSESYTARHTDPFVGDPDELVTSLCNMQLTLVSDETASALNTTERRCGAVDFASLELACASSKHDCGLTQFFTTIVLVVDGNSSMKCRSRDFDCGNL